MSGYQLGTRPSYIGTRSRTPFSSTSRTPRDPRFERLHTVEELSDTTRIRNLLSSAVTRYKTETLSHKAYTPYIVELSETETLGFEVRTQVEFLEIAALNRIVMSSCLQGVQVSRRTRR
jgi:hypothetical protein